MAKKLKDIQGTITKITQLSSKTHIAKRGQNIGKEFTIFSIGILLTDGSWHNIHADSEEKVYKVLTNGDTNQMFCEGQTVKIYEISTDAADKFWKINSITGIGNSNSPQATLSENVQPSQTKDSMHGQGPNEMDTFVTPTLESETESKARMAQEQLDRHKKQLDVQPIKEAQPVLNFKTEEANKFGWGMAVNNAAIVFTACIPETPDVDKLEWVRQNILDYANLTKAMYDKTSKARKEMLGH